MTTAIHLRNVPLPPEIFNHSKFITFLAKYYRPEIFVEYGIRTGTATKEYAPYCKKIIGVDLQPINFYIPNLEFYQMSTQDFGKKILPKLPPIDMAFIDADHNSEVAFQDFEDLLTKMNENGIIFLHDTYPCSEEWTKPNYCEDSWKVPFKIKEKYSDICDVFTIPIQPGLTMVRVQRKELDHMRYKSL